MLAPKACLAAAEVAFFSPALVASAFILYKHGLSRQLGWFYLVLLSILRLIGSSCTLYMATQRDYSGSLIQTATITSAVGTAPLLLALMGFLVRVNEGLEHKGLGPNVFRPIHLISLAALIVSIVGATHVFDSSPSAQRTGKGLLEAAGILFLVIYLSLCYITIRSAIHLRWILASEKNLIKACTLALPFLCVRIVFTVCVSFGSGTTGPFSFGDINVWVAAFMQFLNETVVVSAFVFAGFVTPKWERMGIQEGVSSKDDRDAENKVELGEVQRPAQECGRV
ncbi:hypothetical protein KC367_g1336 [Hortaea werneckii]|nr:hypothetical protein KC358_g18532 [Hortaea werneckii]OTA39630.1 hypothetical protein BTJ68_00450 [Hortaea werneckii EXF-2000]KAI6814796.1 hypothetical protein KC350_g11197 [Hortaea werneckii]KAI6815158.1 hypothetical protein KC342_g16078 [Hortaea werneckii]KAI6897100.1 hypothetical protein KC348_g17820 [Hortaea werneckii]